MGNGAGLLVVMFIIDIMLFANGFIELPMSEEMFDIEMNTTSGEISYNESNDYGITTDSTGVAGGLLQNVFDTLGYVWDWILFILSFVFAPLSTMIQIGAPLVITACIGIGWFVLGLVSIVSMIRGFSY